MSDSSDRIIKDFREEIKHAYEPGARVMSADRELRFCFELQRDRLAKKNLTCSEEMTRRGLFSKGFNKVRSWQDGRYETTWAVDFIDHKKTFSRDGMRIYKKRQKQSMYETVVDVHEGEDVSGDKYCCPNCGATSTIAELQEGCPHCGTSFKMSELYPKVSNFFYVYDESGTGKELFLKVVKYGLCLLPVTIGLFLWTVYSENGIAPIEYIKDSSKLITMIIGLIITTPIVGYSDHDEELPFYKGDNLGDLFDDVADITFRGMTTLKKVRTKENMVYVTADLYVETAHDLGTKIKVKRETYRVTAGRRLDVPFTANFSITEIECKSCGGSFNAYKTNKCPYCGTEYTPEDEDWALYDIQKR